jgi:adhesin transport system outer membrane protein
MAMMSAVGVVVSPALAYADQVGPELPSSASNPAAPGAAGSDTTEQRPAPAGPAALEAVSGEPTIIDRTKGLGQLDASAAGPATTSTLPPRPNGDVAEPIDAGADATLYGPPAPKVAKGKLPEISWNEPPAKVPPALDEAINIVTRNYPSAKSSRAALGASAADVRSANWRRFPTVGGNLSYLGGGNENARGRSLEPQFVAELPVWSGGRITADIRRAKAAEDASSSAYIETVTNLALTTTQAYFDVVRLAQREQLLAESLKEHQRLVGTMERRVKQEVSPEADLNLARSRAAQIEQEYTLNRAQRRSTLRILAELIADPNYDLGAIPSFQVVELPNRDSIEDQGVAYDPELRRLRSLVTVAEAELDASKASILPQVNAQYTYDDVFGSRVGMVLRQQTSGGLSQFSEVDRSRLRIQSALEDVRVSEQQLRREIANEVIELDAARARAQISTGASETAARVSESYMRQFITGRRSWLDVMNALREAVTAQLGKVDAEASAMSAAVRLTLRTGRWHPEFSDATAAPALAGGN